MSRRQASKSMRARVRARNRRSRRRKRENRRRKATVGRKYGFRGYWSCGRKNRYPTRADAESVAIRQTVRSGTRVTCYRCELCGGWHLTSHPRKGTEIETIRGVRQVEGIGEEDTEDRGGAA